MSPRDDSSQVEAGLRRVMERSPAPPDLGGRVMAAVRAEARRQQEAPERSALPLKLWPPRPWALAACACAALLALALGLPRARVEVQPQAVELAAAERELAEVLLLAGSEWNRAQAAAFPLEQEGDHD